MNYSDFLFGVFFTAFAVGAWVGLISGVVALAITGIRSIHSLIDELRYEEEED